ncbi:MAG: CAP domain-containing protein [Treponema sp.]|jgi:uncharacterized protein YkwD|nr:CAP domain-containing protein [Treponema sp.]
MKTLMAKNRSHAVLVVGFLLSAFTAYALDADGWDIDALDTARNVNYLTQTEKDVILELNKVRSNPAKYAELYIKPRIAWFDGSNNGKGYKAPGQSDTIVTVEGASAVQECIANLSSRESAPLLALREGLFKAARDHALDTGAKGIIGHTGSDSSTISGRLNRYGQWGGIMGENISYGPNEGREIVIQLLIDDNVPSRGHRTNNMNKNFACVGVSIGTHTRYETICVIDFSTQYISTNNTAEQQDEENRAAARFQTRNDPDAKNWSIEKLDTAKNLNWLTGIEKDVMLELNKLRSDPQNYARLYLNPNHAAYRTLLLASPAPLFTLEQGLCLASKDNSGSLGDRIKRYGSWRSSSVSSTMISGPYQNGRDIIADLLNGSSERTLDATIKHIGFSVRFHEYGMRGDFIFTAAYTSNPSE